MRIRLLLLLLCAGPGCIHLPGIPNDDPRPAAETVVKKAAPPPGPRVTADQVNEKNAHQKARALTEELDRLERETDEDSGVK